MAPERRLGNRDTVSASEIASYVYCPEQWRLHFGEGHETENVASLGRGERFHEEILTSGRFTTPKPALGSTWKPGPGCLLSALSVLLGVLLLISSQL
jgi:hypothetical protein